MPAAERTIEIAAPPAVVMEVINDFSAYTRFLPEMEQVEVLSQSGGRTEVRFAVKVIRRLEYTLRLEQVDELNVRWSLVEGAFKSNDGGWKLEPLDGGARTRATYKIDLQVGMFVPGNIVRSLVDRSLPDTLARFKAESEKRNKG
jgi:ribosome-associated toxin RatA of RatAB toxin-antitoxin module